MSEYKFNNLSPFKFFILETFPFIQQEYFDAMNEWQLFCKVGEKINEIINSQNSVGQETENLNNAFITLKNYIDNYFENLDVQEEVNIKLNEMAESGDLAEIINQEIFGDLKNRINQNATNINTLNTQVQNIQATVTTEMVVFGDSWSDLAVPEAVWSTNVASELRLNLHNYAKNGAGFVMPTNNLIETQITRAQNDDSYDKNLVKYVIMCGGINDYRQGTNREILRQKIVDLYNTCKTLFPNAKILYVNNFEYPYSNEQSAYWYLLQYNLSSAGVNVLNQDGFFKRAFFLNNKYHLTNFGQLLFGSNIISALSGGQIKNDGVIIQLADSHGYAWFKRIDNLIMYYITANNLQYTNGTSTVNTIEENCWVSNLNKKLLGGIFNSFLRGVCQCNANSILFACEDNFDRPSFSGCVPINVEL